MTGLRYFASQWVPRLVAALGVYVMVSAMVPALAGDTVTGIRIGNHPGKTRFVLDLSASIPVRVFTLADPYRVVVDIPEVAWHIPTSVTQTKGLITGYRFGLFMPGTSRLVIDLNKPATITSNFVLPPQNGAGHRFVLDLVETNRTAFLRDLRPPAPGAPPVIISGRTHPKADPVGGGQTATAPRPPAPKIAPSKPQKRIVVIDPGHGGVDPGAIGRSGGYEKHITLAVARLLAKNLNATGRFKAVLTRERDIFIRLRNRVAIARDAGADLFVSLHADTIADRSVRGASVYTLSERASDKEAAALADRENKADLIAGVDLTHENDDVTNILIDLAQRDTMNQSARFASGLVDELHRSTKMLRKSHRFAGFAVLKAPDVPSVLVELGFMSNVYDEKNLRSAGHRNKVAGAISRAIVAYFKRIEQAQRL